MADFKRINIKVYNGQHSKLKLMAKAYPGLTQEDLIGLIIDLTLTNPETLKPHIAKYLKKKEAEEAKHKEMQRKAQNLLANLTPEQQEKLLAGELDLSKL